MGKKLLIYLFLMAPISMFSQQGFLKVFDSVKQESAVFQDLLIDNDTLIFYALTGDSLGQQGIGFYKVDTFGNVILSKVIVDTNVILTTGSTLRSTILKTKDGHYAILGSAIGASIYFLKVDRSFDVISLVFYEFDEFVKDRSLIETDDGFLFLLTKTQPNNSLAYDVMLVKVDDNGQEIWRKQYGSYEFSEAPSDIVEINSNKFLICGGYADYPEWDDPYWPQSDWVYSYFMTVDSLGNQLWEKKGEMNGGYVRKVLPLSDGGWIYIGGTWEFDGEYYVRPVIGRIDDDFNIVWRKVVGYLWGFQGFFDLEMAKDGNFIATGFVDLVTYPVRARGVHYKFTPNGDDVWVRRDSIYGNDKMKITSTEVLSSGSIISIGFDAYGPYGETGFIIKLSPDGCLDTLNCIPMGSVGIPSWGQANLYPNPAKDYIQFDLPKQSGKVNLELIDLSGRILLTQKIAHQEQIDISFLPQGMYGYRVMDLSGDLIGVGKLVVE